MPWLVSEERISQIAGKIEKIAEEKERILEEVRNLEDLKKGVLDDSLLITSRDIGESSQILRKEDVRRKLKGHKIVRIGHKYGKNRYFLPFSYIDKLFLPPLADDNLKKDIEKLRKRIISKSHEISFKQFQFLIIFGRSEITLNKGFKLGEMDDMLQPFSANLAHARERVLGEMRKIGLIVLYKDQVFRMITKSDLGTMKTLVKKVDSRAIIRTINTFYKKEGRPITFDELNEGTNVGGHTLYDSLKTLRDDGKIVFFMRWGRSSLVAPADYEYCLAGRTGYEATVRRRFDDVLKRYHPEEYPMWKVLEEVRVRAKRLVDLKFALTILANYYYHVEGALPLINKYEGAKTMLGNKSVGKFYVKYINSSAERTTCKNRRDFLDKFLDSTEMVRMDKPTYYFIVDLLGNELSHRAREIIFGNFKS